MKMSNNLTNVCLNFEKSFNEIKKRSASIVQVQENRFEIKDSFLRDDLFLSLLLSDVLLK